MRRSTRKGLRAALLGRVRQRQPDVWPFQLARNTSTPWFQLRMVWLTWIVSQCLNATSRHAKLQCHALLCMRGRNGNLWLNSLTFRAMRVRSVLCSSLRADRSFNVAGSSQWVFRAFSMILFLHLHTMVVEMIGWLDCGRLSVASAAMELWL